MKIGLMCGREYSFPPAFLARVNERSRFPIRQVFLEHRHFGRFGLDARNPNIGELEDRYKREFEEILGTKLRVIYQHI